MKSFFYALLLMAVVVGSVLWLRSVAPPHDTAAVRHNPAPAQGPAVESLAPSPTASPGASAAVPPAELVSTGVELLNLWHVREATDMFERAIAVDSTDAAAWVLLVECYADPLLCREDDARAAWDHAARFATAESDSSFLSGVRDLFLHGDYGAAVDEFARVGRPSDDARDAQVRYYRAVACYRAGRLDDAEHELEDLLTADDTVGRVVELSIRVMVASGDLEGASQRAHELARMYAEEPFPYVLLAQIDAMRGRDDSAAEFCNNALVLDARYIPAVLTRANLYAAARDMEPARVSFEKLLLFDDLILRSTGQEGIAFVEFYSGHFGDGVDAMDEAIRDAVMAGSVRRALSYAARLVDYLCELGQADEAEGVIDRWVNGFGDVPVALSRMRIDILRGDISEAHRALVEMKTNRDWLIWAQVMGMDYTEMAVLTDIAAGRYDKAIELAKSGDGIAAGVSARRSFFEGYAAFESGDAESAQKAFAASRSGVFGVEFPYRGDPVLAVQTLFYAAETSLAAGDAATARTGYAEFLDYWGDADWDLPAVRRAREKLSNLPPGPSGDGD